MNNGENIRFESNEAGVKREIQLNYFNGSVFINTIILESNVEIKTKEKWIVLHYNELDKVIDFLKRVVNDE